ncbi:MAG: hypothetical protein C0616_08310 [Desulfuromonas sp.]|nr:MAG: hypothetical protein C0616_08310 [Desulfuromonas sp.]
MSFASEIFNAEIEAGIRVVEMEDAPARAQEYGDLESSATGHFRVERAANYKYEIFEGTYVGENEWSFGADYNRSSLIRLNLNAERFYHNLDHIPYDVDVDGARQAAIATPNDGSDPPAARVEYFDDDPGAEYGRELSRYEAKFRAKLSSYPAHLNVTYWRYEKRGEHQLRYAKEQCTSCHLQSRSNEIDQVTDEVTASVDAHLGPVDVVLEHLYRQFNNRTETPRDEFAAHTLRPEGEYQHDEIPDSRLNQTTLKLNTSLDGGLVAAASYSFGERQNRSDLERPEVGPVEVETEFQKAAGDFSWNVNEHWSFNFRYRMLDLDNDNPSSLYTAGLSGIRNPLAVRDNIDLERDTYGAMVSFRPTTNLSLKAEFEREDLERNNTGGALPHSGFGVPVVIDPVWELPRKEQNNRYKLSFHSRPFGGGKVKMNGYYKYLDSDDPAYGTSLEDGHRAFVNLSMQAAGYIGGTVSLEGRWEENNQHQIVQPGEDPLVYELDREYEQANLTLGFWFSPNAVVSMGCDYALLTSTTQQDLLFGNEGAEGYAFVDQSVDYEQTVSSYSAYLNIRPLENLKLYANGYYVRSDADFNPGFLVDYAPEGIFNADSSGLKDISKVDVRRTGAQAGMEWEMVENLTFGVSYQYDDYSDKTSDVFDGNVQVYSANLAYLW